VPIDISLLTMKYQILVTASLAVTTTAFVPGFTSPSFGRSTRDSALFSSIMAPNGVQMTPATPLPKQTSIATAPMVAQRWRKSTKQVATLGPASSSKEMIEKLFLAGADVFRLNFSHGSQEQKKDLLLLIREIEEKYSHPIAILGDLQGPKLRVSTYL
jgi:Pyruvate kinase, barrel domain